VLGAAMRSDPLLLKLPSLAIASNLFLSLFKLAVADVGKFSLLLDPLPFPATQRMPKFSFNCNGWNK
jgi:hypothetical protein